jgi:uncharacterized damage-inducible protein DinB
MTSAFFVRMFTITYKTILANIDNISHKESIQNPDPGGNCINWVIGHIITSRDTMLKLLGRKSVLDEGQSAVYARGSSGQVFTEFKQLVAHLRDTHKSLISALKTIGPKELDNKSRPGKTVADDLAFLYFHEAYHTGQLGLLRRMVGKTGAIQ